MPQTGKKNGVRLIGREAEYTRARLGPRLLVSMRAWILGFIILASITCGTTLLAQDQYKFLNEIPIGGDGGWDILTIDAAARRLYLAHATKIEVVDIDLNKVTGEIQDTPGVHAFLAVPGLNRGFSSNGKENKSSVVNLDTLKTTAKLDTGNSPDAITYDPAHNEVYVLNHRGNSATVIDAKAAKVLATIPLDGIPEFAVTDDKSGRVYCNIEDKSEVAVIDSSKHQVVATWSVAPGEEPSGIALDAAHHQLFATCRKVMVMLNTESGKVTGTIPIGAGADGCAFDEATQFAFASCGDGTTTIARATGDGQLTLAQTLKTERGARTMALDPKTHRIFLPTAQFGPPPSVSPGASPARPSIVPNTFKLLVYGPAAGPAK
jgi:YVTN family beta-propeller protein